VQLTAVFETWHIGDGNYPPLRKGQLVNLSFELEPHSLSKSTSLNDSKFAQIKDAEYSFVGTVLRIYPDPPSSPIVVVEAGDFHFYMNSFPPGTASLSEGDACEGYGRLLLDHYIWVEFLDSYDDPPNLFYPLRLTRIRSVKNPNSFISRSEKGMSGPTSCSPDVYSTSAIGDVERMENVDNDWLFYLVDFDDSTVGAARIPLTFRSRVSDIC
jgi:hypothetical protein